MNFREIFLHHLRSSLLSFNFFCQKRKHSFEEGLDFNND